jgi:hypothetical protein
MTTCGASLLSACGPVNAAESLPPVWTRAVDKPIKCARFFREVSLQAVDAAAWAGIAAALRRLKFVLLIRRAWAAHPLRRIASGLLFGLIHAPLFSSPGRLE